MARATIDTLRKRRARLATELEQLDLEIAALTNVPRQVELLPFTPPVSPPRVVSKHEERYGEFLESRRLRLQALGVEPVADESHHPAFINATVVKMRAAVESDEELFQLFDLFLAEPFWARAGPPFPFRALASEKVWGKLVEKVRGDRDQKATH